MTPPRAPQPRDDDEGLRLERFVPYRLATLADSVSRALGETYDARFGVTIPEWRILAHLGPGGALSAGELSDRTRMEKPRVSRALRRMADKGLIERDTDPRDQRVAVIRVSRSGARLYARIVPLALEWEQDLLAGLSPAERRQLHDLLDRLDARVAALRPTARR